MSTKDLQIRKIIEREKMRARQIVAMREFHIPSRMEANDNCGRCFGRGFAGHDSLKEKFTRCSCLRVVANE